MKIRLSILIILNIILAILLIFACVKEDSTTYKSVETFEMTGGDGQCYEVTLERLKDNSINFTKKPIQCSEGYSLRAGVYLSPDVKTQKDYSGKRITFIEGSDTYWYIPLTGGGPIESPGNLECFCELQEQSPGGDPCNGQGTCGWHYGGKWVSCTDDGCCAGCDIRICNPTYTMPINNGIIVAASSIKMGSGQAFDRNGNTYIYYGGNVRMVVELNGNSASITRTILGQASQPKKLYNLTSLTPSGNSLNIPPNGQYYYVPFDIGSTQRAIYDPPTCHSDPDDPCTGECSLEPINGCMECDCSGPGDCDMQLLYASGGVIIQSNNIQIIDQ